jgi:HPt (histidine-containing phosphotransfer) domain-containing protein
VASAIGNRASAISENRAANQNGDTGRPIVSCLPSDDREFCEVIIEFAEQLEVKLAALNAALANADLVRIGELAHWVKGAGGTAGFGELTARL